MKKVNSERLVIMNLILKPIASLLVGLAIIGAAALTIAVPLGFVL